jgi:hypothetical protein
MSYLKNLRPYPDGLRRGLIIGGAGRTPEEIQDEAPSLEAPYVFPNTDDPAI